MSPEAKLLILIGIILFFVWKFFRSIFFSKQSKKLRGIVSVTNKGETVKSKAEMRIANVLNQKKIEFDKKYIASATYKPRVKPRFQKISPAKFLGLIAFSVFLGWFFQKNSYAPCSLDNCDY